MEHDIVEVHPRWDTLVALCLPNLCLAISRAISPSLSWVHTFNITFFIEETKYYKASLHCRGNIVQSGGWQPFEAVSWNNPAWVTGSWTAIRTEWLVLPFLPAMAQEKPLPLKPHDHRLDPVLSRPDRVHRPFVSNPLSSGWGIRLAV